MVFFKDLFSFETYKNRTRVSHLTHSKWAVERGMPQVNGFLSILYKLFYFSGDQSIVVIRHFEQVLYT